MTASTTSTGTAGNPLDRRARLLADRAPMVSDLRSIERATRWVGYADAFLAIAKDHPTFTIGDVEKLEGCPPEFRERARDLVGRDGFPIAIGRTLSPQVDSLILDYASYDIGQHNKDIETHESYSIHALVDNHFQMVDIVRRDRCREKPNDALIATLERGLFVRKRVVMSPNAPIFATHSSLAIPAVRKRIAEAGLGYALPLEPGARFDEVELPLDAYEEWEKEYTVEEVFQLLSTYRRKHGHIPPAIPTKCLVSCSEEALTEYLVQLQTADGPRYFVARPAGAAAPNAMMSAIGLAECGLSVAVHPPLSHFYHADKFHHRNPEPWENVMLVAALYYAVALRLESAPIQWPRPEFKHGGEDELGEP